MPYWRVWRLSEPNPASLGDYSAVVRKNSVKRRPREGVFVMQAAKDRFGTDRIGFSATMPRRRTREDNGTDRRIGNTGTQRHVRAAAIVMSDPGF
jgi:hypothetical protein